MAKKYEKTDSMMHDLIRFGKTWWGKKWIESMLLYGRYFRMHRGINYANENRVSNVLIKKGEIFGQCQGTAPAPYRIRLNFEPLTSEQWNKIIKTFSKKAIYEGALVSGDMPENIDQIFADTGIPLFPPPKEDLNATCSCPDKEIPCKHIAALILTLARIFDYDPFQLIKLRGMDREEILNAVESENYGTPNIDEEDLISQKSGKKKEQGVRKKKKEQEKEKENESENESVTSKSTEFFLYPEMKENIEISFQNPVHINYDDIIERIGAPPEISNENDFIECIKQIYSTASEYAKNLIFETNNKNEHKKPTTKSDK